MTNSQWRQLISLLSLVLKDRRQSPQMYAAAAALLRIVTE